MTKRILISLFFASAIFLLCAANHLVFWHSQVERLYSPIEELTGTQAFLVVFRKCPWSSTSLIMEQ